MEELYKTDTKTRVGNILLAGLLLILFFVGDAILYIPWKINYYIGMLLAKSNRKKEDAILQKGNNHFASRSISNNFPATGNSFARD